MTWQARRTVALLFAVVAVLAVAGSAGSQTSATIVSVALSGSPASPTFTLNGRSFGTKPAASQNPPADCAAGLSGDLGANFGNMLWFKDTTNGLSAGLSGPLGNGVVVDCVGLVVSEFTPTRIAYTVGTGFAAGHYAVNDGDLLEFHVNGGAAAIVVHYGQTAQNLDVCTVPRVIGLQLTKATASLRKARCEIGKATRPKKLPRRPLIVKLQRPAAGAAVPAGTRVAVTLG